MPVERCRAKDGPSARYPGEREKHRVKIRVLRALLAANLNVRPRCLAGPGVDEEFSRADDMPGALPWITFLGRQGRREAVEASRAR